MENFADKSFNFDIQIKRYWQNLEKMSIFKEL